MAFKSCMSKNRCLGKRLMNEMDEREKQERQGGVDWKKDGQKDNTMKGANE